MSSNLYYDLKPKLKSDAERVVGKEFKGVEAWI